MKKEQTYFNGGWFGCAIGWTLSEIINTNSFFLTFLIFLLCYFGGQHICSKIWGDKDDSGQKTESN